MARQHVATRERPLADRTQVHRLAARRLRPRRLARVRRTGHVVGHVIGEMPVRGEGGRAGGAAERRRRGGRVVDARLRSAVAEVVVVVVAVPAQAARPQPLTHRLRQGQPG